MSHANDDSKSQNPEAVQGTQGPPPAHLLPVDLGQHGLGLLLWSSSCDLGPDLGPQAFSTLHAKFVALPPPSWPWQRSCLGSLQSSGTPQAPLPGGTHSSLKALVEAQSLLCGIGSWTACSVSGAAMAKYHQRGGIERRKFILSQAWRLGV